MSRIFDALKKSQTPLASPVNPVAAAATSGSPVATAGVSPPLPARGAPALTALPRIEVVHVPALEAGDAREVSTLRVGLESALEKLPTRVVMFASSQGGEGTSTVARRFAAHIAAEAGRRVLLADLHAGRPVLSLWMERELAHPEPGPVSFSVLPLPHEVRERGTFGAATARPLLAALGGAFDWVVLDGPPVLGAPESVELAALADGVVLVVQSGSAKRPVVSRAAGLLRSGGARVLGTVLNRRRHEIPEFIYRRI